MNLRVMTLLVPLIFAGPALAWGPTGHQIVSSVGSTVATERQAPFWTANADAMCTLSTVPDRIWKAPQTKPLEAPTHWFQADAYISDLNQCSDLLAFPKSYDAAVKKYGQATILKNGTAQWRINQLYTLAVSKFKTGDATTGLQLAGAMSHYIGDLSMPLHVSENYDGASTGNNGIHKYFESENIRDESAIRSEVFKRAQVLLQDRAFLAESSGDIYDIVTHEIIRSLQKRDEVLANDTKYGRSDAKGQAIQLNLAEDRMADGAAVLSIILARMTNDAGLSTNSSVVPVRDPDFIKPDFSQNPTRRMKVRTEFYSQVLTSSHLIDGADDCAE